MPLKFVAIVFNCSMEILVVVGLFGVQIKTSFVVDVIVFKIMLVYDNTLILKNLLITNIIVTIAVISQILIYIYIIEGMKENERLKVLNECNEVINEIVQEIKQRQHDFIN